MVATSVPPHNSAGMGFALGCPRYYCIFIFVSHIAPIRRPGIALVRKRSWDTISALIVPQNDSTTALS